MVENCEKGPGLGLGLKRLVLATFTQAGDALKTRRSVMKWPVDLIW
jgi:hypothetical protein